MKVWTGFYSEQFTLFIQEYLAWFVRYTIYLSTIYISTIYLSTIYSKCVLWSRPIGSRFWLKLRSGLSCPVLSFGHDLSGHVSRDSWVLILLSTLINHLLNRFYCLFFVFPLLFCRWCHCYNDWWLAIVVVIHHTHNKWKYKHENETKTNQIREWISLFAMKHALEPRNVWGVFTRSTFLWYKWIYFSMRL